MTGPKGVDVGSCLAHLKLLHAIQGMKEDVGYTDGLWNLWDSRAADGREVSTDHGGTDPGKMTDEYKKKLSLSKIREKRWALFVARAVDRYEAWWNTLQKQTLTETDMSAHRSAKYAEFPTAGTPLDWKEHMLPPLGAFDLTRR